MRSNDKLEVGEAICDAFQMSHEERITAGSDIAKVVGPAANADCFRRST